MIRNGSFYRKSDSRHIQRFHCLECGYYFSAATTHACFGHKKRRIHQPLFHLFCSGVSQRRAARILRVNPKTIAAKLLFLAKQTRIKHEAWVNKLSQTPLASVQFDDLETSEHSKCKPLSVALAVEPESRKILSFQVSQMPAKGLLKKIALQKYGSRRDERGIGWDALMRGLKPIVLPEALFVSDENPHYPRFLKEHFPQARHKRVKAKRGCVSGQGELKKIGFDPLFSLNHTCAMLRANLNRLFRRSWCTTKKRERLVDHITLYVWYHNQLLTPLPAG